MKTFEVGTKQPRAAFVFCYAVTTSYSCPRGDLPAVETTIATGLQLVSTEGDLKFYTIVNGAWPEFRNLAQQWRNERGTSSSVTWITSRPSYLRIIALGEQCVPYILKELQKRPDHWFTALRAITQDNPVAEQHRGNMRAMAADWINWGISKGYIPV